MAPKPSRTSLFPAIFMLVSFAFLSCNDSSNNDNNNLPKTVASTVPGCKMAGLSCASDAQCCGLGNCVNGSCNSLSCIQPGDHCLTAADCCNPGSSCGGTGGLGGAGGFCQ